MQKNTMGQIPLNLRSPHSAETTSRIWNGMDMLYLHAEFGGDQPIAAGDGKVCSF